MIEMESDDSVADTNYERRSRFYLLDYSRHQLVECI